MKIKSSPLEFIDFYILQSNLVFVEPNRKNVDVKKLFANYNIDIDFSIKTEDNNQLLVFIKVEINNIDKNKDGYSIFAEGVAIFNIEGIQDFNEQDKSGLMFYSTLSIAINNIRNYISNLTSNSPLGKYNLPAIDVNDLHSQKKKLLGNKNIR